MLPVIHFLYLGAVLLSVGIVVIIIKRNAIMVLLGIELMLNAANLNLIGFNQLHANKLDGQLFAVFIIVVAVTEAAVGLAIVLRGYKFYQTSVPDEISELKG